MNNLSYQIQSDSDTVKIKNNKSNFTLTLNDEELKILSNMNNIFYKDYYKDILLVNKSLQFIFQHIDEKYHRYINLNIKCANIYTENALKEWIYKWFDSKENQPKIVFKDELESIFNGFKKCKIHVY